jgi:hypothetical protein
MYSMLLAPIIRFHSNSINNSGKCHIHYLIIKVNEVNPSRLMFHLYLFTNVYIADYIFLKYNPKVVILDKIPQHISNGMFSCCTKRTTKK